MISVSIDNLGKAQATELFETMSDKAYVFRIDCTLDSTSSVRIEAVDGNSLFSDLEKFYYESR